MSVLRDHKDSLMAMLEAFVHDPLISWRLLAQPRMSASPLVGMPFFFCLVGSCLLFMWVFVTPIALSSAQLNSRVVFVFL